MYNPKHRNSKKASKDNKAPLSRAAPLPSFASSSPPPAQRSAVRFDDASSLGGGGGGEEEFDLGKVLQESWDLERTADDEFLLKNIAFPTPRRQLEQLEYQSNQLNEINTRVSTLLHDFEEQYHKDDAFHFIEENEDQKFFDKKSLLEESKGKVKVLVVDYNKLSLTRDAVLTSLREWFDVINNDDISDSEADEERGPTSSDNSFSTLVKGVNKTKDKLAEVHTHLVDYCNQQIKTASQHNEQEEARKAEVEQLHDTVDRLNAQIMELNGKLRDADARNLALQKTLDRTNDELKFFRLSDSSKTGQLKDELFQTQQKAKDRETELTLELDKTTKKLAKTQDQLDQFVLSLHQEQQNTAAAIEELTTVSEELRALKHANAKMLEESSEKASGDADAADAQDSEKGKDVALVRSRAQEELLVKMYKMKNEHEEHNRKMLDDHAATIHRLEAQHQEQLEKQTLIFAESMKSKDSKSAMDSIKASYEDKMKKMLDQHITEKEKIKKDHARHLAETVKEHQIKFNFQAQQLANQKTALDHDERVKRDVGAIGGIGGDEAHKRVEEVTEMYEQQVMQARNQIRDRDEIIEQLKNQLAMVTGLLGKTKNAPEAVLPTTPLALGLTKALPLDKAKSGRKTPTSPQPSRSSTQLDRPASRSNLQQQPAKKEKPRITIPKSVSSTNQQVDESSMQKAKPPAKPELSESGSKKPAEKLTKSDEKTPANLTKIPSGDKKEPQTEIRVEESEDANKEETKEGGGEQEDVASLLQRLEDARTAMDKKLDTMREKDNEYAQKLEVQKTELQKVNASRPASRAASLQNSPHRPETANLQTPTKANLQNDANLHPITIRTVPPPDDVQVSDAKVDGYLMELRAEVTNLTKDNETLRSQLTSLLEQYAANSAAPTGQPTNYEVQENPKFVELEARLSALVVENEMLRKGEQLPPSSEQDDEPEPGGAPSAEIILKAREAKLTQALQDLLDANAKVTMLEDQVGNYEKAMQDADAKRIEMEASVASLTQQINKQPALATQAELQLRAELERTMAQERTALNSQIASLEKQLAEDVATSLTNTSEMRLVFRKEVESMQVHQDEVLQAITDNYETRIKGLTEALTACLNDTDIAEELRKDAEYKILATKLVNEKDNTRLEEEIRVLKQEHALEMQNLEKKDKQELQRLRNTLERLQLEFETFINEDNHSTTDSIKSSVSRTSSIISNVRMAKAATQYFSEDSQSTPQTFSNLQTGIVGMKFKELPGGEIVNFKSPLPRSRSPPRKPATNEQPLIEGGDLGEPMTILTLDDRKIHENEITKSRYNSNLSNDGGIFSDTLSLSSSLQGIGKAVLINNKPADVRSLIRSMETATNEEISVAVNMYQGFKTMFARQKFLQDQKTQERFVETQQLQFENASLKKSLAAARGRIAELERQLLAIKNQNLEHKYRSEIGVSEYKAIISHQEQVIDDLRHTYRRNQGALVATQERKGRLEKSVVNLHITISDHEKTITSLQQTAEEMRVQIEDLKRWQLKGSASYGTHNEEMGPLRIRTMLPESRGEKRGERLQKALPPGAQETLQAEPNTKNDRTNLQMMEHLLKAMDDSNMDETTKSSKEVTLSLLETDKEMRKQKVGAIFHKLHHKFQLKSVREEIVKNPDDRLAIALRNMEARHSKALVRWDERRQDLVEKRKLHLLQVMRAFSTIMASNQARYETGLQPATASVFPARKLPEMRHSRSTRDAQPKEQIDYTQLFPRNPPPAPPVAPAGSTGNTAHVALVSTTRAKLRKQPLINPRQEPEIDMVLQIGHNKAGVLIQGTQVVLGKKKDDPFAKFSPDDGAHENELLNGTFPAVNKRASGNVATDHNKSEKISLPPI